MSALLLTLGLMHAVAGADMAPPLPEPFAHADDANYSLFTHDKKIGEVHATTHNGVFTADRMLLMRGPRGAVLSKNSERRVYSNKDGLLESVVCVLENPNMRVEGHREGADMVLNMKMSNTVTQYRVPAPSIQSALKAQRLVAYGVMGAKVDGNDFDCTTGKAQVEHAVLQSKAQRRVNGATVTVYKVMEFQDKPADNAVIWLDGEGHEVEMRLKGGLLVFQRDSTPTHAAPKNPFTSDGSTP